MVQACKPFLHSLLLHTVTDLSLFSFYYCEIHEIVKSVNMATNIELYFINARLNYFKKRINRTNCTFTTKLYLLQCNFCI